MVHGVPYQYPFYRSVARRIKRHPYYMALNKARIYVLRIMVIILSYLKYGLKSNRNNPQGAP